MFITAPAQDQDLAAPIIVALLDEIREEIYNHHRTLSGVPKGHQPPNAMFALDEAANIAPLPNLAAIICEARSQGLQVLYAFQDLSQARSKWGQAGEGFLSLFSQKLVFPGIADHATLNALEILAGDWDRPIRTSSRSGPEISYSHRWTTQRSPVLSTAEIANIPSDRLQNSEG